MGDAWSVWFSGSVILILACAWSSPAFCMMYSACKLNKQGDNIQPEVLPFGTSPFPILMATSWPAYRFLRKQVRCYWFSHLFKNFPQFAVIHTVTGFSVVNNADLDVISGNLFLFLWFKGTLAVWYLVPLPFPNPAWTSGSSWFMYCWSLAWRILSITLLAYEMSEIDRTVLSHYCPWRILSMALLACEMSEIEREILSHCPS